MGVYNRDYMRDEGRAGGGIPSPRSWSLVAWLVVLTVAYYLIDILVFNNAHHGEVSRADLLNGHVYLLVSYMFVHGHLMHLAFNMVLLWFAGKMLLQIVGQNKFMAIYFGGGILGAGLQLVWFPGDLVGASAGCMAILCALAAIMPNQVISLMLFFVLPLRLKLKTIAGTFVLIDVVILLGSTWLGWDTDIGHLAHLGGAFFGWAYVVWILPRSQARAEDSQRKGRWQERFGARRVVDAEVVEEKKRKKDKTFVSEDVDAILDKISEEGMQSLTAKEKKILEKSSEKLSRRVDRG